ncbi:MAG TPA: hypothetical protein VMN78_05005 [Longimicrobiales bacterium]|nr:hypothetical protein [Longimicrobiales bacterium]
MGSDTGGYVRLRLETQVSHYDKSKGILHRRSELGFERAPSPAGRVARTLQRVRPPLPAGPGPLSGPKTPPTPAGKVALGGLNKTEVTSFDLWALMDDDKEMFMTTVADDAIAAEAMDTFGGKWAGFAVLAAPSGTRFRLITDISFKPTWKPKADRPFQVVPVVMAFGTDRFQDHYLLALIVAQKTDERVDTSVTQPYQ